MTTKEMDFLSIPLDYSEIDIHAYQYFDQLFHKRTILFNEEVDTNFLEQVYLPLRNFEQDDNNEPITLILSTPGGSVSDSLFICDYLQHYKKKLNIIVCGYACSMGTVICAGVGTNPNITRYAYPHSYFLIHDGFTGLSNTVETKTAQDIMMFNAQIDEKVKNIMLQGSKISEEMYDSKARKQWYLFAQEAKEFGIIDKIIGEEDDAQ